MNYLDWIEKSWVRDRSSPRASFFLWLYLSPFCGEYVKFWKLRPREFRVSTGISCEIDGGGHVPGEISLGCPCTRCTVRAVIQLMIA